MPIHLKWNFVRRHKHHKAAPSMTVCSPVPSSSPPVAAETRIRSNDVLLGRGVICNNHPGNLQYRALIKAQSERFGSSDPHGRATLAASIVQAVRSMDPPGRFLRFDELADGYCDVGDVMAVKKTTRAFRDSLAASKKQDLLNDISFFMQEEPMPSIVTTSRSFKLNMRIEGKRHDWTLSGKRGLQDSGFIQLKRPSACSAFSTPVHHHAATRFVTPPSPTKKLKRHADQTISMPMTMPELSFPFVPHSTTPCSYPSTHSGSVTMLHQPSAGIFDRSTCAQQSPMVQMPSNTTFEIPPLYLSPPIMASITYVPVIQYQQQVPMTPLQQRFPSGVLHLPESGPCSACIGEGTSFTYAKDFKNDLGGGADEQGGNNDSERRSNDDGCGDSGSKPSSESVNSQVSYDNEGYLTPSSPLPDILEHHEYVEHDGGEDSSKEDDLWNVTESDAVEDVTSKPSQFQGRTAMILAAATAIAWDGSSSVQLKEDDESEDPFDRFLRDCCSGTLPE